MILYSPKMEFLGGGLISSVHASKVLNLPVYINNPDLNYFYLANKVETKDSNEIFNSSLESILCMDTCVDGGYYDTEDLNNKNEDLYRKLALARTVHLVNHQPPNRYYKYLLKHLKFLIGKGTKIILYHYRASWIKEFEMELGALLPQVENRLLPYFYDPYILDTLEAKTDITDKLAVIGRDRSKCKISNKIGILNKIYGSKLEVLKPNPYLSNADFVSSLKGYDFIFTGYYYGHEGNPEESMRYNKLEWSLIDAMIAGAIPITNTLFLEELERLNIQLPTIGYHFEGINNVNKFIDSYLIKYSKHFQKYRTRLINELKKGNYIFCELFGE